MIWYLLGIAYLGGLLISSVVFADTLLRRTGTERLTDLDGEDWAALLITSLLWPLTWSASLWLHAVAAYRVKRTDAMLKRYGADLGSTDDAA